MITADITVTGLSSARDSSVNAAFMDFDHAVTIIPDALFVFYEGQDNDYYYPRLQQYANRNIETIKCKGKVQVIDVYKLLKSKPEYNKYHKGFFIDKDFDLNTDSCLSNFYITSGYSIENFYLSDNCIETFLKQKFNFHTGDPLLAKVIADYRKLRRQYFDAILLFNSWYCAIRRKYGDNIRDICIDNKMPTGFISYDKVNRVYSRTYTISSIQSKFTSSALYPVSGSEMQDAENYIRGICLRTCAVSIVFIFYYVILTN